MVRGFQYRFLPFARAENPLPLPAKAGSLDASIHDTTAANSNSRCAFLAFDPEPLVWANFSAVLRQRGTWRHGTPKLKSDQYEPACRLTVDALLFSW